MTSKKWIKKNYNGTPEPKNIIYPEELKTESERETYKDSLSDSLQITDHFLLGGWVVSKLDRYELLDVRCAFVGCSFPLGLSPRIGLCLSA